MSSRRSSPEPYWRLHLNQTTNHPLLNTRLQQTHRGPTLVSTPISDEGPQPACLEVIGRKPKKHIKDDSLHSFSLSSRPAPVQPPCRQLHQAAALWGCCQVSTHSLLSPCYSGSSWGSCSPPINGTAQWLLVGLLTAPAVITLEQSANSPTGSLVTLPDDTALWISLVCQKMI